MGEDIKVQLYTTMVRIRTYEEAILREYHRDKSPVFDIGAGRIPGEMHLSAGQEPVAAGLCAHLRPDDAITAPHRPHHLALAHGVDMKRMTAEIFGRESGLGRGKGGHMHLFDPAVHFGCSGIIAQGAPTAVGAALAFKRQGSDRVAVSVVGEGAANQGGFHESLNLASLWRLPVVFVIEDNGWGISVPRSASTSVPSNIDRAAGYAMPGELVEDNSVDGVYEAAGRAVTRARKGEGPTLLEIRTIRLWGHFEGDAQAYRGEELAQAQASDPLPIYEQRLLRDGLLDEAAVAAIKEQAVNEVEDAIAFALSSAEPAPEEALEDVFA